MTVRDFITHAGMLHTGSTVLVTCSDGPTYWLRAEDFAGSDTVADKARELGLGDFVHALGYSIDAISVKYTDDGAEYHIEALNPDEPVQHESEV